MSEFSESFHLAGTAADAIGLLERSGRRGWIISATNEWATFVVEGDFRGEPDEAVVRSNVGALVYYVNAEDHGTGIEVFIGPDRIAGIELDWNGDEPALEESGDIGRMAETLGATVGHDAAASAIESFRAVSSFDEILGSEGNPGHRLAAALRLPVWEWLSGHYVEFTDPEHRSAWTPVGAEVVDPVRWIDVDDLPEPPGLTWQGKTSSPLLAARPSRLLLPLVDDGWQGGGTSQRGWYWSYQAKLRGAQLDEVNDELLRRAKSSGFVVHVTEPHPALPDRRFSLWNREATVVASTLDQRGTLVDLSIVSPVVAEGLELYPATIPEGFSPLD